MVAVWTSGSRSTSCPSSIPRSCCTWPMSPSSIPSYRSWPPARTGSPRCRARRVGWPWTSSGPTCSTGRSCVPSRRRPRGPTTTWPTSSTTSWRGPRPTRRQGSTPSASGGGPNRAHATRCSGSHPATRSTTIAGPEPGDPEAPDHTVRIVAALVNPVGPAPEAETVTVVNASSGDIDLTGWSILDREKRRLILDAGTLPAGDALRIRLGPPVALGNSGGLITLLNPDGLKVDGVAYTKAQATPEGRSLIF